MRVTVQSRLGQRLQDRDTPVPIDPAATDREPDEETKDEMGEQSPSSRKRSASSASA